ncbi:MAG: hypothetical protein ABSC06_25015 [Rhodopila sp.]|jgi:hypothetical protein
MADRDVAMLNEIRETIEIQTQGLMKLLGIMAQHGAMQKEILAACTAPEPDGESPLVKALTQLGAAIEGQSAAIARIEKAVTQPAA